MNKQKITLPTSKWGTVKSKYQPEDHRVSNDEFTKGSVNFITNNTGAVEKRPTDVLYNTSAFSVSPKDQFEAIFSSGTHHLLVMDGGSLMYSAGDRTFTAAATGFTPTASMEYSMYQNRVYMDNGIDNASVYDITPSYGGVSYSTPAVKTMGAQVPASAPTFNADSAGGSVPAGGHTYKVTYLYYDQEESNGGSASALHTVSASNYTVNLKTIPVGDYGVTARNIYRDNNDGNYLLVGTISNNTATTFVDAVSAGTTPIPASNNLPPIFTYISLNLSRQFVAGVPGSPSVLFWSLPGLPDIFDPNNFIICNPKDPITSVYTYQGITTVFNRHSFGKILGNTDDTFEYEEVSGTVGCVDNRSIQVRTIDGVPVLVWLSDRGFYKFDGSSVTYISDPIEDLVNFNLQQVSFTTGSNNQSTKADYEGGVASPSIDLDSDPGTITVLNPKQVYQSESDWEGGLSLTNIATAGGTNQLKVPTRFVTSVAAGSFSGSAIQSGVFVTLPTQPDGSFTSNIAIIPASGGNYYGLPIGYQGILKYAQKFAVSRAGAVTSLTTWQHSSSNVSFPIDYEVTICNDALGTPGAPLWTSGHFTKPDVSYPTQNSQTFSPSLSLAAGTYWIVTAVTGVFSSFDFPIHSDPITDPHVGNMLVWQGAWIDPTSTFNTHLVWFTGGAGSGQINSTPTAVPFRMTFAQTTVAASGSWQSPIFDSFSVGSAVSNTVTNSATYPASTSATLFVDESSDSAMNTGVTTFTQSNPNGTYSPGLSGRRYWRVRYALATTDDRVAPSLDVPRLVFSTTGTWISHAIDCTADVTAYSGISVTQNVPTGTTVTITVATSDDNVTYTSFGPVGSASVKRYVKIKIVLATTSDNASTPSVTFVEFSWAQTSTFTSSIVNVGLIPTGWGVFQDAAALNGGTLTFYMRSASSSGGIPAATFYPVSNGAFPPTTVPPQQYAQWKIVATSTADNLPAVNGVTLNWFIGTQQNPIRAASLFFNKTYYFSGARFGSTTNDVVILWDFENLWRVFTGINADAMSLFFNEPFYCDSARNNVYQWLIPATGEGSAIVMDVRTKAFDLENDNVLKNVRSLRVTGINTGTAIHAYYSVDRGVTWIEMLNVDGTTGYTTATDGSKFSQYFVADYSGNASVSGTTVMYRVTSTDAFPCVIMKMEPVLYSRSGKYLERPI